jgi:hypothetical protein
MFIILGLLYCYICNMKNDNIKIFHQQITLNCDFEDYHSYFIIIETVNFIPVRTYVVNTQNFKYYDETMKFYVVNKN